MVKFVFYCVDFWDVDVLFFVYRFVRVELLVFFFVLDLFEFEVVLVLLCFMWVKKFLYVLFSWFSVFCRICE